MLARCVFICLLIQLKSLLLPSGSSLFSMPHKPEQVFASLKNRQFAPVYFLQGEEPYYIDLISDYIEKNALPEHEKGFNQMVLYGKDINVGNLLTQARRFPMMAEKQVIIVKEAQDIPDLNREDAQKLLESYLERPLASTILVLNHKYKTLDGRKSLAKTVDKHAILVESKKLYDNKLPEWITTYLKDKGFGIHPAATQMLADSIGNDLSRLSNEIDKLLINCKDKKEVTAELVQQYVGISKEYNVFELQKAFIQRDILKANQIIQYFEANPKSNPLIVVVATLFTFYSKVLVAHHSKETTEAGLAKVLGVNPFFVKDYQQAMRAFPLMKVINIIHHLRIADLQAKGVDTGQASEGQILKELVFKILH
jgi:DNA polymerase III subunit delta